MPRKGINIYKRKDGRWEGRFYNGKKNKGRKKYSSVYGNTYTETRKKLLNKLNNSICQAENILFTQCASHWIDDASKRVKPSTLANYSFLLEKHILPYFKQFLMKDVSVDVMSDFINDKLKEGKLKRRSGLSKKYLKDIVSIIKQIANYAEQHYGVHNKIRLISSPRPDKKEIRILSSSEIDTLTSYLMQADNSMNIGILISLFTGMRIGEICGLKWEDIDLKEGIIRVRRTVQRICNNHGNTTLIVGSQKTNNSFRIIPLPPILRKIIAEKANNACCSILTGSDRFAEPNQLRNHFKTVLAKCKIENIKFHSLRHTFASECVKLGFDIKALSEILGHSSAAMTLDRYAHTSLETKRMYMNRIAI